MRLWTVCGSALPLSADFAAVWAVQVVAWRHPHSLLFQCVLKLVLGPSIPEPGGQAFRGHLETGHSAAWLQPFLQRLPFHVGGPHDVQRAAVRIGVRKLNLAAIRFLGLDGGMARWTR